MNQKAELKRIPFHKYRKIDSTMKFRDDRSQCVKDYNLKNNTCFRFISEFVYKNYFAEVAVPLIAETIEVSKNAVYVILMRMGVPRIRSGGKYNYCHLTGDDVVAIRKADATYVSLSKKYRVSPPTISAIVNKTGRWVNF